MKKPLLILLILFSVSSAYSQQKKTVLAKGETPLEGVLPYEMLYSFTDFTDAIIIKKDASETIARININLFTGDILFLSPINQILVIAYPEKIARILMNNSVWLAVDDSFGKVVMSFENFSLVKLKKTRITDTRKESGFGGMSSTTSSRSGIAFTPDNQGSVALPVGEYDFETNTIFRLVSGSKSTIANAQGYKRLFPDKKKKIKEYLKANSIDFDNEKDQLKLIDWILDLS